jgi:thiamine biosynthesis lipoprotein
MIRSIEFRAMNTNILLAAEGERAIQGMQAAKAFIDECEQRFSRFLPASELTELNRYAGEWLPVSRDLMEMLELAMKYYQATQGIFDPSILPDLKQAGYDRSMDEIRAAHGAVDTPTGSSQTSKIAFDQVEFNPIERQVRIPGSMEIDLGGIAKGWIVKQAAVLLHQYSEVCGVSAGGDVLFIGQPSDGLGWDIYLEDPRAPAQMLAQLNISSGAVATSSVMKRSWQQGNQTRHHLIDPRTGQPAQTEWLSVTVICPDIIAADVYAKTILIGGPRVAKDLLERMPELSFIAVDQHGNLVGSPNFKEFIYEPASDLFFSTRATR